MLRRLAALIRKELLALLRDPRGRAVLIGPPIMQLLVFSFAATLEVTNADIGVLNYDAGKWGVELIHRIEAASAFDTIEMLRSTDEMRAQIDLRRIVAAVHIPADFSRAIEAGQPANVLVVLDGRRSNATQILAGYLSQIVASLSAGPESAVSAVPRADPIIRHWFNPTLDYQWFTVPSLVAVIALMIGLVVTALSVARERELGTFDQLLVSPLSPVEILVGKTVPPLLVGLFHASIYIAVARYLFGIPFAGSLVLLYVSLLFYLASVIGIGLFISSLAQTQQQATLGAFLFMAPATLLSGFVAPVENMPEWLQPLTMLDPLRHFLVVVRGVFLKAMPAEEVLANTWPMALIALVTLTVAAWLFRRGLE